MRFLLPIVLSLLLLVVTVGANAPDDQQQLLEDEIMRDTIAAGRGDRDEVGVRDQWSSEEHLRSKNDIRAGTPISTDAKRLLREYRLECHGCNQKEAVAKINAFVIETKRTAKAKQVIESVGIGVVLIAAAAAAVFMFTSSRGNTAATATVDDQMRRDIQEQRIQQTKKEELQRDADAAKRRPTWRDNEEMEVWTAKQDKQFEKALATFGGVPPKERYHLIAAKVDDKTKQECLMHHKLQQVIAKEQ
jgi:hypothetical protein